MKTYFLLAIALLIAIPAIADPIADAKAHSEAFQKAFNSGDADAVVSYMTSMRVLFGQVRAMKHQGKLKSVK
jgi:ketosteroid isomerase-like protein